MKRCMPQYNGHIGLLTDNIGTSFTINIKITSRQHKSSLSFSFPYFGWLFFIFQYIFAIHCLFLAFSVHPNNFLLFYRTPFNHSAIIYPQLKTSKVGVSNKDTQVQVKVCYPLRVKERFKYSVYPDFRLSLDTSIIKKIFPHFLWAYEPLSFFDFLQRKQKIMHCYEEV